MSKPQKSAGGNCMVSDATNNGMRKVIARWEKALAQRHRDRSAMYDEERRHLAKIYPPFIELLKSNPDACEGICGLEEMARRRVKHILHPLTKMKVAASITGGSVISVFGPPYAGITQSSQITQNAQGNATPMANSNLGTYGFTMFGGQNGGSAAVAAGVYTFFTPVSTLQFAHFRPFVRFSDSWSDQSGIRTAHNDGYLHAAVVQFSSSGEIAVWPPPSFDSHLWSDGTGWFDNHSGSADDQFAGYIDVSFPISPGIVYGIWTWCEGSCDDAGSGHFGGYSFASATMNASTPFMVVEESGTP